MYTTPYPMQNLPNRKNQMVGRQEYVYWELVETSSVQSQNQKSLEDRENQYIGMTHAPRRFYGQVTHTDQNRLTYL